MNNIIKTKKGFTLVELVIVIVIVGILSVISVPIYRGYVEKAKYTEGYVLLNAIAKAELAYHVKYDCFVYDYSGNGYGEGKGYYLDIDSGGNKYFTGWRAEPRNSQVFTSSKNSVNKAEADGGDDGDNDDGDYDYVDIYAFYYSPKGQVALHMEVCSNGGCSEVEKTQWEELA